MSQPRAAVLWARQARRGEGHSKRGLSLCRRSIQWGRVQSWHLTVHGLSVALKRPEQSEPPCFAQCSNEAVFAVDFHPTDTNIIVTCGKSHLYFWTLEGNCLIKKQGLFEVKFNCAYS